MPPKRQSVKSNRVCFTLNNYSQEEVDQLLGWLTSVPVKYAIVGKEVGASKTPHLQGFVHLQPAFLKAKEGIVSKWKGFPGLARAHLENAKGSDEDSKKYCSKDGEVIIELGSAEPLPDLWSQIARATSEDQVRDLDPESYVKYHHQIVTIIEKNKVPNISEFIKPLERLRDWQLEVFEKLTNQNDRNILFVIDEEGGKGKSVLGNHLAVTENAFLCTGGREADLTYAFRAHLKTYPLSRIAVIDMARCNDIDHFPWNFMENLKNNRMVNKKYKSETFFFHPQKVVVFMNQEPERSKLSADRFNDVVYL